MAPARLRLCNDLRNIAAYSFLLDELEAKKIVRLVPAPRDQKTPEAKTLAELGEAVDNISATVLGGSLSLSATRS